MDSLRERKRREQERRVARAKAGEIPIPHGSLNGYNNYACRCSRCTGAYMEWYEVYATRKPPTRKTLPPDLQEIADAVDDELAQLIQEQYNDDKARRIGYSRRLPSDETLGATTRRR